MATRRTGRPRLSDGPAFDHEIVDKLLVQGEKETTDGRVRVKYPSQREVAARVGVSVATINRFWREHDCAARRRGRATDAPDADPFAAIAALNAPDTLLPFELRVKIVNAAYIQLADMIKDRRLRPDHIAGLEKLMKTASELDAEQRSQQTGLPEGFPTLDELIERHERMLQDYARSSPAERGLVITQYAPEPARDEGRADEVTGECVPEDDERA
jgi:DNA-binding transcriptional MocR family regulator